MIELRNNFEDLVADSVHDVNQNEELLDIYLNAINLSQPDWREKADEMYKNAIGLSLDVMKYIEMTELLDDNLVHEDFNQFRYLNFRKEDILRDWDHLHSKFRTLPDPDLDLKAIDQNPGTDVKAIANITVEEIWKTVDEKDKIIIKMSNAGYEAFH